MRKVLVGLDRDDTINYNPDEYYGKQKNWKKILRIYPTVIEGIKLLNENGCIIIVASNQSGVARGLFPFKRQRQINTEINKIFNHYGAKIHSWQFCPFCSRSYAKSEGLIDEKNPWILDDDDPRLDLRKPAIGMLKKGVEELGLALKDFYKCFFVGDRITDVQTGLNADGIGILIDMEKNYDHVQLINQKDQRQKLVKNFYQAAKLIVSITQQNFV